MKILKYPKNKNFYNSITLKRGDKTALIIKKIVYETHLNFFLYTFFGLYL
jgi:hypothetical protein